VYKEAYRYFHQQLIEKMYNNTHRVDPLLLSFPNFRANEPFESHPVFSSSISSFSASSHVNAYFIFSGTSDI
jgi:hypothetical protein